MKKKVMLAPLLLVFFLLTAGDIYAKSSQVCIQACYQGDDGKLRILCGGPEEKPDKEAVAISLGMQNLMWRAPRLREMKAFLKQFIVW